jgi:hypothetical protein
MSKREPGAFRFLLIAMPLILAGCAASQLSGAPRPLPEPKRFRSPLDLSHLRGESSPHSKVGKIIYIGVYGGGTPPWEEARYFNPKDWPPYSNVLEEEELNEIAFQESLMHVLAIQISRLFPNSITLMIRGDNEVVTDVIRYLYSPGDKIYLVGHSQGAAVIGQAVYELQKRGIPVQMMAQMEGFRSYATVPGNVVQAFNFYVPSDFALCPGRDKLEAEAPTSTRVSNEPIPKPWGPFAGPCAEHRNIDSDPRVWKAILQYIIDSAAS